MILHVLNGDATRTIFEDSGLQGDHMVWREMFCEGRLPVTEDMHLFFEERAAYLQQQYGLNRETYLSDIRKDYILLNQADRYDEVVLWFEFDLFCQVNLLFALYYLRRLNIKLPPVSIVQLNEHPEVPNFRGFGMLSPHHLPPQFEKRTYLTEEDWQLALEAWKAYSHGDPLALETISHRRSPGLPYLGEALQAHLRRLPSMTNGLNAVEHFFLDRLALGKTRERELYHQFWDELKIYGFGDFQLDHYAELLQQAGVVRKENEMWSLTGLGEEVLQSEENYLSFASKRDIWLGGIPLEGTPWRWNEAEGKVAITD